MLRGSEYTRVLNMSGFWIYQGHEYASGSEYARVLNMLGLTQGFEYASICLIMSGWICLDMSEYAGIWVNMPKSAWIAFVLYFPIVIPCLLEGMVTYFNVFTKLEVLVWMKMRLKFDLVVVSVLFGFYFRLNISTSKISNLLLPLGIEGGGACESWCTSF